LRLAPCGRLIDVCQARGELRPGKAAGAHAAGCLARRPPHGISPPFVEKRPHCAGPALRVADRAVFNRRAAHFPQDGKIACDDRRAARHRLEERQAEALALRWLQHKRRAAIHRGERPFVEEVDDRDAARKAQVVDHPLLRFGEEPAHAYQVQVGHARHQASADRQERVDPLSRNGAADMEQFDRTGRGRNQTRSLAIRLIVGDRVEVELSPRDVTRGRIVKKIL